uniref:NADH-ubiquinone oxidoreductase chain 2 n=1 Tax=Lysmata vittata TaxID=749979 RepID=A0A7D5PYE3_9EUCA|nr:NADH dehydrogenase subunit 2 [Lysmata vittata]QLI42506.1 NADH dehydrogenase subunit 2 [Lysmata vittata]QQP21708.1 NADH dehydrogenase subunit 2 [Lysmata vittata]
MTNPSRTFFLLSSIMGVIYSTSSTSWLASWIGLELNLISFIPIMFSPKNIYKSEAALKYFLIQALGSSIILFWAPMLLFSTEKTSNMILLSSLTLKLGAAPFHLWLPSVMQGLSWPQCFLLLTMQKIAPLVLISYLEMSEIIIWMIYWSSCLSAMIGGLGGLNQTFIRKIMAYSSINHLGWMMSAFCFSEWSLINYFLIYSFISLSIVSIFHSNEIFHLSNIISTPFFKSMQLLIFIPLFSLGGLPPFLGFFPKLLLISNLIFQNNFIWTLILTMSALFTLFFYLRILMSSILMSSPKMKFNKIPSSWDWNFFLSLSAMNFFPIIFPLLSFPVF